MQSSEAQFFSLSLDWTARITFAVVLVIFIAFIVATKSTVAAVFFLSLGAAVGISSYVYRPTGYALSDVSILVKRLAGDVRIPLDGICDVRRVSRDDLFDSIRLARSPGCDGMFGYYGKYRMSSLGDCTWYLTNRNNAVAIVTAAETVLVSPDNVDEFLAAVQATVPVTEKGSDTARTSKRPS